VSFKSEWQRLEEERQLQQAAARLGPIVHNQTAEFLERKQAMHDAVNSPPHYRQGGIECIDAIEAALTAEEFRGYCKGNALKYIWRERHKGQDESLRKAIWYLNRAFGE
jgi:hypothetical protein